MTTVEDCVYFGIDVTSAFLQEAGKLPRRIGRRNATLRWEGQRINSSLKKKREDTLWVGAAIKVHV